jgi:CheY-like chemotaxis protein
MDISEIADLRVLIIDDEDDTIELVRMVLEAAGAEVYEASDGAEGYDVYRQQHPDLILTDLSMPGVDGWQLLIDIRSTADGQHIPVIALTAHAMIGDKERVLEAGFTGYISKPMHMTTLLEQLQQCLSQAAL